MSPEEYDRAIQHQFTEREKLLKECEYLLNEWKGCNEGRKADHQRFLEITEAAKQKAKEEATQKTHEEAAKALDSAKKESEELKLGSTALAMAILDGAPIEVLREQAEFLLKK